MTSGDDEISDAIRRATPDEPRFRLNDYPFFLMNRAAERYNATLLNALAQVGVDRPTWRALMILNERDPASVSEIAELAVMKLSTITRVVQRMQAEGNVVCRRRESDARVTEVCLTPRGRQRLERVQAAASSLFLVAVRGLSGQDVETLNALLRRVGDNLGHEAFEPDHQSPPTPDSKPSSN